MKAVAIITARGGSKRIPRKNIKPFLGKPIIEYSIKAALESGIFDEVMVSTEDEEIAEVARQAGAVVPFMRSKTTADDFATTSDVLYEVLNCYEQIGKYFEEVCCIYPTAPFVTAEDLIKAKKLLSKGNSVIPVVKYSFPPQRAFLINEEKVSYQYPAYEFTRSQDLPPVYHDCGQFYYMNAKCFMEHKALVLPETIPYYRDELVVQDIDNIEDWHIAEIKYQHMQEAKS